MLTAILLWVLVQVAISSDDTYKLKPSSLTAMHENALATAERLVAKCETFACLNSANQLISSGKWGRRFKYPHFLVVGWQKSATTSLWAHLVRHPQVIGPYKKEPHFFTVKCDDDPLHCPPHKEAHYIQEVLQADQAVAAQFTKASFEASAGYGQAGHRIAAAVRQQMPWVKIVASLREPISRAISWLNRLLVRPSSAQHYSCLKDTDLFTCLKAELQDGLKNYSYPLSKWVEAFPRDQLFIVQYERLIGDSGHLLADMKRFLGIDPQQPSTLLETRNSKKHLRAAEGWQLQQWQYEYLLGLVRPDAQRLGELLSESGLGVGWLWVQTWEEVWQENLSSCDAEGMCRIRLT